MVHTFQTDIAGSPLPTQFTYPFQYTPHPLCVLASEEIKAYLNSRTDWHDELQQGKMFGTLIVQTPQGDIGYLAAFSGNLAGKNQHEFFVPPIFDYLQPDGRFRTEEKKISEINRKIKEYESILVQFGFNEIKKKEIEQAKHEVETFLFQCKIRKKERDQHRQSGSLSEDEIKELEKQSQFDNAELKRKKHQYQRVAMGFQSITKLLNEPIETLKERRKKRSIALQTWLFKQFRIYNAKGKQRNLFLIFKDSIQQLPPAGAGECAAPKLLQYAYINGLKPLAMAEFWWGNSPKGEIRRHGSFYPSCKSKCKPILSYMLQGLDVEPNPLSVQHITNELEIVFEDEYIVVVNKPSGILSVPGKEKQISILALLKEKYPQSTGPLLVHRIDMATSGLLLAAKDKNTHALMQAQFENHKIKKRYIALLDGILQSKEEKGFIRLPLRPDYENRPSQLVDWEDGKPAVTRYEILGMCQLNGKTYTRIAYFPQTGSTHQLRVHSAHPDGMNCPILGDSLYGQSGKRLYLHAEELEFKHPITGKLIKIKKEAPF